MADDSNPYVYSKDEVEARAQKHIDEYKTKMEEYAAIYRENEHEKNVLEI